MFGGIKKSTSAMQRRFDKAPSMPKIGVDETGVATAPKKKEEEPQAAPAAHGGGRGPTKKGQTY